jgi:hypothetical protein
MGEKIAGVPLYTVYVLLCARQFFQRFLRRTLFGFLFAPAYAAT